MTAAAGFTESTSGWDWDGVQAMLAGSLVRIAGPVMKGFHSDVYRDFQIISDLPENTETSLVYVVRNAGTHLFFDADSAERDPDLIGMTEGMCGWHSTWRITLTNEGHGEWVLAAEPVRVNYTTVEV